MTTTTTPYVAATARRNAALTAARVVAGVLGGLQLAGMTYFGLVAPEEAVWVGPWVDAPVVGLMLAGLLLKLAVAVGPGLDRGRRIALGQLAVALGVAVTLVKIPVYDEPEGVVFIGADLVLLTLLLLARRSERAR